jgi:hypothetical protein
MKRVATLLATVGLLACQQAAPPAQQQAAAGPAQGTPEWKIQNAMSAAPEAVSQAAAVMDFDANMKLSQLRAGSNGWTCLPDNPDTPGNDPMCVDQSFMGWVAGWLGHTKPAIKTAGFAYMLQGGTDASNTDPFKMKPDSGQAWVDTGPHVMMVVPDPAALKGLSTDYKAGGPYIMWQNTPYAHVMMPVK